MGASSSSKSGSQPVATPPAVEDTATREMQLQKTAERTDTSRRKAAILSGGGQQETILTLGKTTTGGGLGG